MTSVLMVIRKFCLITLLLALVVVPTFAKPTYRVDKAIKVADQIVLGEIYKVELVDALGSPVTEQKKFATKENQYKIRNYIRTVEKIYGEEVAPKELILERPIPAYYGKEVLRKGLKLFYFLKKDGTPIDGKYEFNIDRRPRIMEMLKNKAN